jgi:hypothetical protein
MLQELGAEHSKELPEDFQEDLRGGRLDGEEEGPAKDADTEGN